MTISSPILPNDPGFAAQDSLSNANVSTPIDPGYVQRLSNIHYDFPDLHPDVKVALASAGMDSNHPVVQQAVQAQRSVDAAKPPSHHMSWWQSGMHSVGNFLGGVESGVATGAKDVVRGGLLGVSAIPEELAGGLRTVAGGIGGRVGGAVAGAVGGLATGALAGGIGGGTLGTIVPGLGNVVGALGGALGMGIEGAVAGGIAGYAGGKDIKGTGGFHTQSELGLGVKNMIQGKDAGFGSGFFPGGTISAQQSKVANQVASIDGHALTPGRVAAAAVSEPGTKPYNMLSGLVDFATQMEEVKIDPGFKALEKAGELNGLRKTISVDTAKDFMQSEAGGKLKQALVDEKSPWNILERSRSQFSIEDANALAAATTPEQVDSILERTLGTDVTRKFNLEAKNRLIARAGAIVPRGMTDLDNPKAILEKLNSFMRIGKVDDATRIANMDEGMKAMQGLEDARKIPSSPASSAINWNAATPDPYAAVPGRQFEQPGLFSVPEGEGGAVQPPQSLVSSAAEAVKGDAPGAKMDNEAVQYAKDKLAEILKRKADEEYVPSETERFYGEATPKQLSAAEAQGYQPSGGQFPDIAPQPVPVGADVSGDAAAVQARRMKVMAGNVYPAFQSSLNAVRDVLIAHGVDSEKAQAMTRLVEDDVLQVRSHVTGSIAANESIPGIVNNGKMASLPSEHALSEMLRTGVELPDIRDVRSMMGAMGPLMRNPNIGPGTAGVIHALDYLMSNVWKPAQLLRVALPIRVLGEEQARMAAAGLSSFWTDPLSVISQAIAMKAGGSAVTLTGDAMRMTDEGSQALSGSIKDGFDVGNTRLKYKGTIKPSAGPRFITGWRDQNLFDLRSNPIFNHLAKDGVEETLKWITGSSEGGQVLSQLRATTADQSFLRDAEGVRTYLDQQFAHLGDVTQKDPRLLQYVGEGKGSTARELAAREALTPTLKEMWQNGNTPEKLVGDKIRTGEIFSRVQDSLFRNLMQKPTDYFARMPIFNQGYWNSVGDLMPHMTEDAKAMALDNARQSGAVDPKMMKMLEKRAALPTIADAEHQLEAEHADLVARGAGLQKVKDVLYDLGKRSNWTDSMRLITPFAEPWQHSVSSWSRLISERPQVIRRMQQVVEGARGSGFFYTDPNTNQEVFAYPGSTFLTKMITGAPIPLTGSVKGLNLFAENPVIPGFGPLVQTGAEALLKNKPEYSWLMNILDPHAADAGTNGPGTMERFFAPAAWMQKAQKVFSSPENDRDFANTQYEYARYLVSTGEYNLSSQDNIDKLNKAANMGARRVYAMRTMASFSLPSAPLLQWGSGIKGDNGRMATQFKLTDEFRKMQEGQVPGVDYHNAVESFIGKYGENALLYMQPKSKGGGPPVEQLYNWAQGHSQEVRQFKDVYQYFAPTGGAYSPAFQDQQILSGQRKQLNPDEAEKLANHRVAEMVWQKAKDKVGIHPSQSQRDWLAQTQQTLMKVYPGFQPIPSDTGRVPRLISQMQDALKDPDMGNTTQGQSISLYLKARDRALANAKAGGLKSFDSSAAMQPTRNWLRQIATQIIGIDPNFKAAWDEVFSREMKDDTTATPAAPVTEIPNG